MAAGRGWRWLIGLAAALSAWPAAARLPRPLDGATLYPRLIEVRHNPRLRGQVLLATLAGIRRSRDGGVSWMPLSPVPEPAGTAERCCGTIYELPRTVGALPAGTLLYAATYHLGARTAIRIFRSDDGVRWRPHSEVASGGSFGKGVWEPQFDLAADGALVVFWSDEGDDCCSQKLRRARSIDGETWRDAGDLVRGRARAERPGMATTARLPDGRYAMTYENCGPAACAVFIRFSRDGWTYGDPLDPGSAIKTAAGEHLEHAPTIAWSPVPGRRRGALVVVGQMVVQAGGRASPRNGRVLLVNAAGGVGPWQTIAAPVPVPGATNNYCPNYSSALLAQGRSLLMVASAYDPAGRCRAYAGRGSIQVR